VFPQYQQQLTDLNEAAAAAAAYGERRNSLTFQWKEVALSEENY